MRQRRPASTIEACVKRADTASPWGGVAMDGAEERTAVVLQANKWLWLCDGCLALKVGVGLPAMQEVMTTLARFRGYRVGKHRCSVCQRRKRVIRAVADNPPREGHATQP